MGATEDEVVGWHHQFNGNEVGQTPGGGEGQGGLACCSLWGRKESDMTEQLNNKLIFNITQKLYSLHVYPHHFQLLMSPNYILIYSK